MRPLSIFIVDDDVDFARSLAVLLEIEGHEVELAFSGEEALRKFREHRFDMTFMDVRLPGMSGVDSFLALRRIKPDAKVMMMTAFRVEQLLVRATDAGALGVLRKPIEPEDLLKTLESARPAGLLLLADDDADFLESTGRLLSQAGYEVLEARTGREAVEAVLSGGVDALILDFRLPVLNGLQVYLELKRQGRAVPTLIVTGFAGEDVQDIDTARRNSVQGCLSKPFEPGEFLQAIGQLMSRPDKKGDDAR